MKKTFLLLGLTAILLSWLSPTSNAQCALSGAYWGEFVPTAGSTYVPYSPFGPGQYFRMPVLSGASYTISTCGAGIDTQLTGYQGTSPQIFYVDDNGPECTGLQASATHVPNFSDYMRVQVSQYNCQPGGSASITVNVRQNNNLAFTSSAAAMCAGEVRALTATPAAVVSAQPNSGNLGTFSGTGVAGTNFTAPTPAGASGVYAITYTFGYCTVTQNITVYRPPTVANAGPNQTVCSSSATLAGNTPTYGTGTWTVVSGPGIVATPGSPTSVVNGLSSVTPTTLRWTITNGPCTSSQDDVTIFASATPTVANAGPDQSVCASTATLAGNTALVGTGFWTLVGGSGTITTPGSPTSGITGLGIGTNTFRWTISNGVCAPSVDDVVITRVENPTIAIAGPDQTICATSGTLAGNAPSVGTGTWTLISGAGTITTPSSPSSGLTSLGIGANTFRWTISNGSCVASFDEVIVNVQAPPTTSNAGPDQTVCATTTTLAGNTPTVGTGTWTLIGGTGTITTPSSPTSGITALGVGTNTFRWTIANGTCVSSTDDVVITRDAAPTAANAGPDQSVCTATATLAGNTPGFGTGTWTLISGAGTITTPSSPTSGITGLGVGANTFRWTISNGSCTNSTDDVVITRDDLPTTSNAGADQDICASTATLAGNTPTVGTGTWTLISGAGTITTPSSPTSGITGLGVGANTFRWTISNASCTSSTDDVVITVSAAPTTSNAGSDQTICASTSTLAGNTPTIGTGTWTLISGTGTITTPSSPTSGVTGLSVGANTFRWSISNGTCTASTDDVVITVSDVPTASNAGSNQTVCATTATLAGNTPTVGTGTWTLVSGSGTVTTPGSPTSGVTGLGIGANTFRWTISNGSCVSSFSDVVISRDEQPTTAIAGPAQSINCVDFSTLAGNVPAVGVGSWSLVSGSGVIVNTADPGSAINTLGLGANTFEWSISNGVCPASTDQVVVTVNPDVTAPDVPILLTLSDECSVTAVAPMTTDNCAGTVMGTTMDPLSYNTQGVFYINWTFDDGNGNTSSTTQTVIIDDATAPMPDMVTLSDVTGECEVTSLVAPSATDNCMGSVTVTNDALFPITAQGLTVVTWSYDDGNGNISTQTQNVIIDDVTNPVPDVASLADVVECFEATPSAPTATDNCAGALVGTPDVSFPITTVGTTVVTWTYDDGNGNTITQTQNVVINTVDASVTQAGGTLSANATGVGYTYQWLDCDNNDAPISGATSQSFSPSAITGNYAVVVSNGVCTDTSACFLVDLTGLDELGAGLVYQLYPNPNTGEFTLSVEHVNQAEFAVEVIDAAGRQVYRSANEQTQGNYTHHVDIRSEGNGTYYLRVYMNGRVAAVKIFVKEDH